VDLCRWTVFLTGVLLHGFSFTLFFITAQIYLNERVEPAWRARAQALMTLMNSGVGNLVGFLGSGVWFGACTRGQITDWKVYWGGLSLVVAVVMGWFLMAYHGRGGGLRRVSQGEAHSVVQTSPPGSNSEPRSPNRKLVE
jgi:MFS family permease